MDQMRLLLALVLSFLVFMLWNVFFGQEPKQKPTPQIKQDVQREDAALKSAPAAPSTETKPAASEAPSPSSRPDRPARRISVETPLYKAVISERGAGINSFKLKKFRATASAGSPPMNLFPESGSVDGILIGLEKSGNSNFSEAFFQGGLEGEELSITDGSREIVFTHSDENGYQIQKVYRFHADSYIVGFEVRLANTSDKLITDSLTVSLRKEFPVQKGSSVFEGPTTLVDRSLENVAIDEIAKNNTLSGNIKWTALQTRYFMTALIPLKEQAASVRLKAMPGHVVETQYVEPERMIPPGGRQQYDFDLYLGPKSMQDLRRAGHGLERIIDFGMFDILARPCLWLLNYLYSAIPNYGVAIIILTILSKAILWPLGTKSYKSMSQMKKLQPLIQEIRDKYKGDRKKMNEEIMRLHRTYSINPLGGCLPMILQIPVFFALYRMLDQAIELRHAHFIGWINDLSAPDRLGNFDFAVPLMEPPYGIPVLTLIMGATMLWQQKMTPATGDPAQAKMMMLMPVVFTFIFINFSSGLVLYWLVNNILSIGQQYYTQKKFG